MYCYMPTKKLSQTCEQTKMAGAKREDFLWFLVEPDLFKLEITDVYKNHKTQLKTLDWMCWIKRLFSRKKSVLDVLSLRHDEEDLNYTTQSC